MDPVQYMLILVEQGKSVEDAYSHASQRFGLNRAQLEKLIHEARDHAASLFHATKVFI